MFKLLFAGFVLAVSGTYDSCQYACDSTEECNNDPQNHGSYCKSWEDPPVCFGLYVRENGKYCFQPNDPTCNDAVLKPLSCAYQTTTPPPAKPAKAADTCQQKCDSVLECSNDPHSHGSYCKSWQGPAVCFGLYYRENGDMCFQPNDPTCNDAVLKPVLCEDCEPETTTESPTTTKAPCTHCTKATTTTEAPTTTTPCPPETTEQATTPPVTHATCSHCATTTEAPTTTTTPCPPETTEKPKPLTCQQKCDSLDSCKNDPHSHGSYCKSWQGPQVCFGLYYRQDGSLCFEPNDPTCDDSVLKPVGCEGEQ